ncbi:MAG: hypothetical protein JWO13_427 [Acidobacteriales bacterium]|nr:hypothetical protein [Terriglobales bacterium]
MPPKRDIIVRPVRVEDFQFIRDLAARQPNFTIPPAYVLWLLLRIKGDICLIAEDDRGNLLAYLLAVPIESPEKSLYVWQLASAEAGAEQGAVYQLLLRLRDLCRKLGTQSVIFSALADSSEFRVVRQHLSTILGKHPKMTAQLPPLIAPDEAEFRIDLP